ncbi:MAG: hypothetical protein LBI02_02695, partial [Opitutaceae bacterium]|nr:hypothetical protein [Opitutaceae bacterium]
FILLGLFVTGLFAHGQTGSLAGRKYIGFWEISPAMMFAPSMKSKANFSEFGGGTEQLKGDGIFYGGLLSGGVYMDARHKFQFTAGVVYATNTIDDSYPKYGVDIEQHTRVIPLLVEYHYNYELNERLALRAGPVLGVSLVNLKYSETDIDDKGKTAAAISYGVSLGLNLALKENLHLDFGYKYIGTASTDFEYGLGEKAELDSLGGHLITAALQLRF